MRAYVIKKDGKYFSKFADYDNITEAMLFSNNDVALKDGEQFVKVEIHELKQKRRFIRYGKYTSNKY